jgi:molybdopterin molybdotransferase
MALLGVEAARAVMLASVSQLGAERVALGQASGRTLAERVVALRDQPPFAASAMDGWAIGVVDSIPAKQKIVGESAAGAGFLGLLGAGEAVRVFTGAPVPMGAERVVMQENARRDGDLVVIETLSAATHIRPAAGDFAAGDVLLAQTCLLDAAALGVAASSGSAEVLVAKRPRVLVLTMGAELVAPGGTPRNDQIFESNTFALAAMIETWGGVADVLPIEADSAEAIAGAVRSRLRDADLVLVIGGASVGDYDFAKPAFEALGLSLSVDKIAVRPGKPTWFGTLPDGTAVLGLPGNPASAQVCAHLFLEPLLAAFLGRSPLLKMLTATSIAPLSANGDREHWMRAKISVSAGGVLEARAFRDQDSSLQTVLAAANGLLKRTVLAPEVDIGGAVEVLLTGRL